MKIIEKGDITLVRGIKASGINCGIKQSRKDIALIFSRIPATAAGVFTQNYIIAAPVLVTKEHLHNHMAQAIIANSGIANAATGQKGIEDARQMASLVAASLNILPSNVIVASTGKIGEYLPMENIASGIPRAVASLSEEGGESAAEAILTTDTCSKRIAVQFDIEGATITIAGIAKGAGMIRPNMATMLSFILTDALIDGNYLQEALFNAADRTFNRITVDGDTSTNDMVIVLANGLSGGSAIVPKSKGMERFKNGLEYICHRLALMIVNDGEGATKAICVTVKGAGTEIEAKKVAFRIAESLLVKTSLYGGDCNWGRILAAAGSSGVEIDPQKIDISYGPVQVVKGGIGLGDEQCKRAVSYLASKEIEIVVDLNIADKGSFVWTTDLSPEYVHLNADYIT